MLVHRGIVGAATGGLVTVAGLALLLHPTGSQRLVTVAVIQVLLTVVAIRMIMQPGPKRPLTWPMAMLGAIAVTGVSLIALGQVPHEWITYADAQLNWGRRDLIIVQLGPIDFSRMALRDMIEAGLYTNSFAAMLAMFLMWQRRHAWAEERAAAQAVEGESVPAGDSAYGRPMTKRA